MSGRLLSAGHDSVTQLDDLGHGDHRLAVKPLVG